MENNLGNFQTFNDNIDLGLNLKNIIAKTQPSFNNLPLKDEVKGAQVENLIKNQEVSMDILKSIEQNTANLFTLVELINQSNENQEKIYNLITEILAIAKAGNKEEAESIYKSVMKKITVTVEEAETISKLVAFTTNLYTMVLPILEKASPYLEKAKELLK